MPAATGVGAGPSIAHFCLVWPQLCGVGGIRFHPDEKGVSMGTVAIPVAALGLGWVGVVIVVLVVLYLITRLF